MSERKRDVFIFPNAINWQSCYCDRTNCTKTSLATIARLNYTSIHSMCLCSMYTHDWILWWFDNDFTTIACYSAQRVNCIRAPLCIHKRLQAELAIILAKKNCFCSVFKKSLTAYPRRYKMLNSDWSDFFTVITLHMCVCRSLPIFFLLLFFLDFCFACCPANLFAHIHTADHTFSHLPLKRCNKINVHSYAQIHVRK